MTSTGRTNSLGGPFRVEFLEGLSSHLLFALKRSDGMPTILRIRGWRVFFYSDEGNEPVHIHARKGDAECKIWLRADEYDVEAAWEYNLTPRLRREIRKIIFDNFDILVEEWRKHFAGGAGNEDN